MTRLSENHDSMSREISPELALVDPELAARARAALPDPVPAPRRPPTPPPAAPREVHRERHYPFWARVTAALWLLVLGILIGGAAIPHAQDRPRVIPKDEDPLVTVCEVEPESPSVPSIPGTSFPGGLNR
jgi:hypothetical protein